MTSSREMEIVLKIKDEVSAGLKTVKSNLEYIKPQLKEMALAGSVGFGAVTYAVKQSVDAFAESEQKMAVVNSILSVMGKNTEAVKSQIVEFSEATTKLGFDNETTAVSMAKLFQVTGSLSEAQRATTIAMDLARFKQIDLDSATKLVTMTLAGNTRSLRELGIELDDTATPLANLGKLEKTVAGQTKAFAETTAGSMEILSQTFGDLKETIGERFAPVVNSLIKDTILPLIASIDKWIKENPTLVTSITYVTMAVTGFMAVAGSLGLALPKLITMVQGLGSAFLALTGPYAPLVLLIAGLSTLAGVISNTLNAPYNEQIRLNEEYTAKMDKLRLKLESLKEPIVGVSSTMKDMADKTAEAGKKIEEINGKISDLTRGFNQDQAGLKQQLGDEFVKQEQKIADIQTDIKEKTADRDRALAEATSIDKINQLNIDLQNLQTSLATEQTAYENAKAKIKGIDAEIAEARRIASLTEFERNLEQIRKEMEAKLLKYNSDLAILQQELADAKKQKAELVKMEQDYTAEIAKQEEARLAEVLKVTAEIKRSMAERAGVSIATPVFSATGGSSPFGSFSFGTQTSTKSVQDAIISPNGDIITTAPDDYLIATKNPNSLGGGIVVNVYGDVSGNELIERVKQGIMSQLRMDTKLSF